MERTINAAVLKGLFKNS